MKGTLETTQSLQTTAAATSTQNVKQLTHFDVLLVDDEYYIRQAVKRNMEAIDSSFRVKAEASNGQEALNLMKQENFHLVITDIKMPVLDGLELSAKIRELYPDVAICILTGFADFDYAREAVRLGVKDYILKPLNRDDLENTLGRVHAALRDRYELPDEEDMSHRSAEEIVKYAVSYMQNHYADDIDIGSLAESLGFTSSYLTKIFNKYIDEAPLKYLTSLRIREAKRLLTETDNSIAEVGAMVGYPDQFHFSKTFRRITGMNPTAYRKSGLSNEEPLPGNHANVFAT